MNRASPTARAPWMASLLILASTCVASAAEATTAPYQDTQSALSPAGAPAFDIHVLWTRTLWLLTAVYIITLVLALIPAWRRRGRAARELAAPPAEPTPPGDRYLGGIVASGVGVTIVILFVLLFGDFVVGNKARALAHEPDPITIEVTGHQWWWEIRYRDPDASKTATDANEIHVPVGRPVRLELRGADVIHSLWVPNISGKKDLIPGHPTSLTVKATRPGTYWGQCAEFCGYQHAKMRLAFVAQSPADYEAWLASARAPARAPSTEAQKHGMDVFMGRTCSMCHTITGTRAGGRLGPDLTHVASRATIAAGSLPNSMGHLAGWVTDPQGIKPGTRMPQQQIPPDEIQPLLEYLENLK